MIVFYTFDLPLNVDLLHQRKKLLMLKISIYTVYRELGNKNIKIHIYSNQPELFQNELLIQFPGLKFFNINKHFSNMVAKSIIVKKRFDGFNKDKNEIYRVINNNFGTAHYRVFLLDKLLNSGVDDLLYLDYDTGIARNYGNSAKKMFAKSNILLEPKTSDSIFEDIRIIYPGLKNVPLPNYINPYACRWNCGIMFLKNNLQNRRLTKWIYKYYKLLSKDIGFTQSADEWSIGLALFKFKMIPEITIENTSFYSNKTLMLLHDNLPGLSPFVHYMDQKNIETEQQNFDNMLSQWYSYFEHGRNLPNFKIPDYRNKNSNEYIWGRFESL